MTDYVQLPSGVVLSEASFASMAKVRPEYAEIATTKDGRDITRGYVESLPLLAPQDSVLQSKGGNHEIYDEVLRDDQVKATFQQRRLAVVSREPEVQPGGKKRQDKKAADWLTEQLEHIRWDAITDKMLYGVYYGYAVAEGLYIKDGATVALDAVKVRDRRRFAFRPTPIDWDRKSESNLVMLTTADPDGESLPLRKFWHFCVGSSHDDEPYGLGLGHWLYWPSNFKRQGIRFWLPHLEKFASPTGVGYFPRNASDSEIAKLLQSTRAIRTDSGIVLPEGMRLELLEATRSGTADYAALLQHMNAAISKVVLGHSAGADSTPGRLGGEDNAADVRADVVKADSDLVCESFNRSIVRWLTEWNFPNAKPPRVWRRIEDEPDLKPQAERDKLIFDMGFKPTLDYIHEAYGDGWEERELSDETPPTDPSGDTAPRVKNPQGEDGQAGNEQRDNPAFAAAGTMTSEDLMAAFVDGMSNRIDPAMEALFKPIFADLAKGLTAEQVLGKLEGYYPQMDDEQLTDILTMAMAAANTLGRLDAAR